MRGARAFSLAAVLGLLATGGVFGQDQSIGSPGQPPQQPSESSAALVPTKGVDGENPLGRLAIVTFGSFPILLLYTDFSFDLGKFLIHGFDANYAPWPFKSEYSESPAATERAARIGVAIGASAAVGVIDYAIRASRAKKARLQREALLELSAEEQEAGAEPSSTPPPPSLPSSASSPAVTP
jgi:hypothetical protein